MNNMADKDKSRVVRKSIIEVGDCEHDVCCGTGECKTTNSESVGELTISIQADVKDAITGFKALQRELRETTKAARELEQAYKALEDVPMQINEYGRLEPIINVEMDGKEIGKAVSKRGFTVKTGDTGPQAIAFSTGKASDVDGVVQYDLSDIPTKDLHEELAQREGVKEFVNDRRGGRVVISVNGDTETFKAPSRVFVITE